MKLYVGTSGFSYKEWYGAFYPEELVSADLLRFYARRLPAVEIDSAFYRIPTAGTLEAWAEKVPRPFRFYLKASRRITHQHRLTDSVAETHYLLSAFAALGEQFGGVLFQLPPTLQQDLPRLESFLELIPEGVEAAFEFRHDSWFDESVFTALGVRDFAVCCADTDTSTTPLAATASWGYLRLRRSGYSRSELIEWATWIKEQKWRHCCVFFKHEENSGESPHLALRFKEIFESVG